MKNTKVKKESVVIFEDWLRYARCLNDKEFRTFISAILTYYKTKEQPPFTGLLLEVWNDIINDLESNVSKRQTKRDIMLKNSKSNPKLNTGFNMIPNTGPDIGSNMVPNVRYNKVPNMVSDPGGMVDGRWDMVDDDIVNDSMIDLLRQELRETEDRLIKSGSTKLLHELYKIPTSSPEYKLLNKVEQEIITEYILDI